MTYVGKDTEGAEQLFDLLRRLVIEDPLKARQLFLEQFESNTEKFPELVR